MDSGALAVHNTPRTRSVMAALNYKSVPLTARGRAVDSFCMTGFAAEAALKKSRVVGLSALKPQDLPGEIEVQLDHRGWRRVMVHDENRRVAVAVARQVRADLHRCGFEMVAACVGVTDARSRVVGEHDLVVEIVTTPDGKATDGEYPSGFLSVELRCRRVWSEAGREKLRGVFRRECVDECAWWAALTAADEKQHWAGRLVVMAEFDRSGEVFVTRGDVKLRGQEFRGLWGWPGASGSLRAPLARRRVAARVPPVARAKAAPSRQAIRAPRPTFADIRDRLQFRVVGQTRVAPVAQVLSVMGRSTSHVGDRVERGKRRHGWPDRAVFKTARSGPKALSGKDEWVATALVLEQLYNGA